MRVFLAIVLAVFFTQQAQAKPARCFTSDEGDYNCDFRAIEGDGSFIISAPNKPTYTLMMDRPGVAWGFADFGTGRNVSLPGPYFRSTRDRACWVNEDTQTKICAW